MRRRSDLPNCKILRVETSKKDLSRKRSVCACGYKGPWVADGWRHGSGGARWYTADRLVAWNWKVHAGNIACHRTRREQKQPMWNTSHIAKPFAAVTPSPSPSRFDLERTVLDRLVKWLHEAEDLHGFCATNGIVVPSPLARFVGSYGTPPGIKPGILVEWEPEHASGTMRAVVTRVADGRIFVAIERRRPTSARRRKLDTETWFEPDEVHRLRVVPALGPHHCPVQDRPEGVPEVSLMSPVAFDDPCILDGGASADRTRDGGFADHCTRRTADQKSRIS